MPGSAVARGKLIKVAAAFSWRQRLKLLLSLELFMPRLAIPALQTSAAPSGGEAMIK